LERERPQLVQSFRVLPTLIARIEEDPWRRTVHEAVLEFWRSDRKLPEDLGANDNKRTGADLTWLGLVLLQCGDPRAGEVLERAAALDRGSFDAHFQLGRILLNRIERLRQEHRADLALSRKAVRECEFANVLNPESVWALTNLGLSLIQLAIDSRASGAALRGEEDKDSQVEILKQRAEHCYREAIRANGQAAPAAVVACVNLVNLIGYGHPESEGLIELAFQFEPCNKAALIAKAAWYGQLKQLDQVERLGCEVEVRRRAVSCHPYDPSLLKDAASALHARATVLRWRGDEARALLDFDEACAILSQAFTLESPDPRWVGRLSIFEIDASQLPAALTHYESAIALLMTDPDQKEDEVSSGARLETARELLGYGSDRAARIQAGDPELGRRWAMAVDTLNGIVEELQTRAEEAAAK
jgi:tetratricopeptide (TPR) repeat protein